MGRRPRSCDGRRPGLAAALLGAAVLWPAAQAESRPQDTAGSAPTRELSTRYEAGTSLRVQVELGLELGDEEVWILTEGSDPEAMPPGARRLSRESRRLAWVDRWLDEGGAGGLHMTRTFERLDATTTARFGAAERSEPLRSPLLERTIEFVREGTGELEVRLLGAPLPAGTRDPATLLEGRAPTLGLDALLPREPVAPGSVWTLADAELQRALAPLVQDQGTFPLATPQPAGSAPMTAYVFIPVRLMQALRWSGEAKLGAAPVSWKGAECAAIELRVQAAFEVEDGLAPGRAVVSGEGRLLFDEVAGRPVLLTLEADVEAERTHAAQDPSDPTRRRVTSRGRFDLTIEVFPGPPPTEGR